MTLAEAGEIFGYWQENPPAHLILQAIARLCGWTPAPPNAVPAAAPPPGIAVVRGGGLGMPAPLDEAELRIRNQARAACRSDQR